MILHLSITVFVSQLIFIGFRTLNVRAVAAGNIPAVLATGTLVHLSWLASVSIGAKSTYEIVQHQQWEYWPVILCSLTGGLIGSYFAMIHKRKKQMVDG